MIAFTGAWERPCAIALSRSSRSATPTGRPSSVTRIPLWAWRWQSTIASATATSGATERGGRDMIASRPDRLAPRGGERTRRPARRASSSGPRKIADAACSWPPPPRASATAAASSSGERLRVDAEHAAVHRDEQHERARVGQVDDLVGEVRDPVDVARPLDRGDEHLDAADSTRLELRRAAPCSRSRSSAPSGVCRYVSTGAGRRRGGGTRRARRRRAASRSGR